jgi:6-phosphofructokinase 1
LHLEAQRSGYRLSVIGIPKTIDNDIQYVWRTFGFSSAVEEAAHVIDSAHAEAKSVLNGVGSGEIDGTRGGFHCLRRDARESGSELHVDPEVPFELEGEKGFLCVLKRRLEARRMR